MKVWNEQGESMDFAVWDAEVEEVLPLDGVGESRVSDFMIDEVKNEANIVIDGKNVSLKDPFGLDANPEQRKFEPIGKRLAERQKVSSRNAELSPESLGAMLEGVEHISRVEGGRKDKKVAKRKEGQQ